MTETLQQPLMIAGPCSAETEELVAQDAEAALEHDIQIMRMSLWKPRTKPFDAQGRPNFPGLQKEGLPLLSMVANMGIAPATEVLLAEHIDMAANEVFKNSHTAADEVVLWPWIGSRNQNQITHEAMGRAIQGEPRLKLMIKNQMWPDEDHWEGIVDYVVKGGADPSQLVLIHRGFAPGTDGFRNTPDFAMAMRVKARTGLPMIGDPSHIAGKNRESVIDVARHMMEFRQDGLGFDGLMVEVHSEPDNAMTDNGQQLSWEEFTRVQEQIVFQAV